MALLLAVPPAASLCAQTAPQAAEPQGETLQAPPVVAITDIDSSHHPEKWAHAIETALVTEQFDDLDRAAEYYRREKTRLPGGDWVLRKFYERLDAPRMSDKDSAEHLEHFEHWMKARPESITARIALAESLHRWAWVARGNGTADKVTAEGWQLFGQRSQEMQAVLEGSRDMKTMDPEWYLEMMGVGVALGWEERQMNDIFRRGVQFEPEYFYLYKNFANYLLPKWYGKDGDSAKFAKDSADRLGGDRGDLLYFQIATVLVKRGNGNYPVAQLDWSRIQSGYRVLTTSFGGSRRTENELAFMAYKYKDQGVAKQEFAQIGNEWSDGVWRDRKLFDRARDWANGHTQWP